MHESGMRVAGKVDPDALRSVERVYELWDKALGDKTSRRQRRSMRRIQCSNRHWFGTC